MHQNGGCFSCKKKPIELSNINVMSLQQKVIAPIMQCWKCNIKKEQ